MERDPDPPPSPRLRAESPANPSFANARSSGKEPSILSFRNGRNCLLGSAPFSLLPSYTPRACMCVVCTRESFEQTRMVRRTRRLICQTAATQQALWIGQSRTQRKYARHTHTHTHTQTRMQMRARTRTLADLSDSNCINNMGLATVWGNTAI